MQQPCVFKEKAPGKQKVLDWIKGHKTELIRAGICIISLILLVLAIHNKDALVELWKSLQKAITTKPTSGINKPKPISNLKQPEPIASINSVKAATTLVTNSDLSVVKSEINVPIEVKSHIRNLAEGMNPSSEKIRTAMENGYELKPGQTWVVSYTKGSNAA